MQAVRRIEGPAIRWGAANIDTDIIIPAAHLKTIRRSELGAHAFETVRTAADNIFDRADNVGAPVLVAGANFGCGSSREHAVWAMMDLGIRAVVAPSYSDIFSGNAFKNGLVAVVLAQEAVDALLASEGPVAVDLEDMAVSAAGLRFPFAMDAFRRECLMEGRDEIALTLQSDSAIAAYERTAPQLGWAMGAPSA